MLRHFPSKQDIAPVFAVVVFLMYSWSIFVFLQKVPSWILFLRPGELAVIFAYLLVTVFLGSLLFTAVLVFFCILLPPKYFRESFVVQGSLVSLVLIGSIMVFINRYTELGSIFLKHGPLWLGVTALIAVLVAYLAVKIHFLGKIAFWISDRLIVYLYLAIPLSVLSLIVVIFRNVF